jgi:hypothetical protein
MSGYIYMLVIVFENYLRSNLCPGIVISSFSEKEFVFALTRILGHCLSKTMLSFWLEFSWVVETQAASVQGLCVAHSYPVGTIIWSSGFLQGRSIFYQTLLTFHWL